MTARITFDAIVDIRETQGPRAYEVRNRQPYWHGLLEGGEVSSGWGEYHLFVLNERTGHITIEGGYGTFSYCWPNRGRDSDSLHAFLYGLNFDYFMDKAAKQPHRVVDYDRTIAEMKRQVIEYRRRWGNSREWARKVWADIVAVENMTNDQSIMSYFWHEGCSETYEMFGSDGGPFVMVDHPGMRQFWNEVWKPFREQILRPHWLDQQKRRPLPRNRAMISIDRRFDRIAA